MLFFGSIREEKCTGCAEPQAMDPAVRDGGKAGSRGPSTMQPREPRQRGPAFWGSGQRRTGATDWRGSLQRERSRL